MADATDRAGAPDAPPPRRAHDDVDRIADRQVDHDAEVLVWHWRLDDDALPAALPPVSALSEAERAKAARFRSPDDRRRYQRAHLGMRLLLAEALGTEPAMLAFDHTCRLCGDPAHGKPRIVAPAARLPGNLDFSLSHADDVALLALSPGQGGRPLPVGCDVEVLRPRLHWRDVSASFFTPAEQGRIAAAPPATQAVVFLRLWTRKEALLKTWGYGVVDDLRAVDVAADPLPATAAQAVGRGYLRGVGPGGEDWTFEEPDLGSALTGAVATVGAQGGHWVLRHLPGPAATRG